MEKEDYYCKSERRFDVDLLYLRMSMGSRRCKEWLEASCVARVEVVRTALLWRRVMRRPTDLVGRTNGALRTGAEWHQYRLV